jgi:hypothetical protein
MLSVLGTAPVEITCPLCSHHCRTDRVLGKGALVRCPACQREFAFAGMPSALVASSSALPLHGSYGPAIRQCPFCRQPINAEARKCRLCGETLDPVLRATEEAARAAMLWREPGFNPGMAMVMSVVWPGLGQIYRGHVFRGIVWMIITPLGYLCFIILGLVLHLLCILFAGRRG